MTKKMALDDKIDRRLAKFDTARRMRILRAVEAGDKHLIIAMREGVSRSAISHMAAYWRRHPKTQRKLSLVQRQEIINLYKSGMPVVMIQEATGSARKTICRYAKEAGISRERNLKISADWKRQATRNT